MTEQVSFRLRGCNPDVLTCIANLSKDEVFTPSGLAGRVLGMQAEAWGSGHGHGHGGASLWANKTVRFLDPFTKSGVFLREITGRLTLGLAQQMPDLQEHVYFDGGIIFLCYQNSSCLRISHKGWRPI